MTDLRRMASVSPVPEWVDARRLLGPGGWTRDGAAYRAALSTTQAADLAARLRGLGLGGHPLMVDIAPALPRAAVRAARTRDARARRVTTPGWTRAGTRSDAEGRWSLTPERLALLLGRRYAGRTVIDACCGVGGNAIGFARAGCRVVAIDTDRARLEMARHNARVYGVHRQITWVCADARTALSRREAQVVFIDPPWGVDWDRTRCGLCDVPLLAELLRVVSPANGQLVCKVPPSFDPSTTPWLTPEAWFGQAAGDKHRIKFVTLCSADRAKRVGDTGFEPVTSTV